MLDANITAIIIAIVGGGFGVWAAKVSRTNQKATRDITEVLNNTKTPVDSLDQVVRLLQEELNRTTQTHSLERKFFNEEIARIRNENNIDREAWEKAEAKLQAEIDALLEERLVMLAQIKDLQKQLSKLERKVKGSLETFSEEGKKYV